FTPRERDRPNRPFRLLFVGNWNRLKGVDLLAPILHALGDGFELHYTADRNGTERRVALPEHSLCLGRLDQEALREAYRQADALIFPSRLEGLPLVVIEAMACGLPVIAANTSALPELVEHGMTGLLCPVDDVAAFAAAAHALAADPARWRAMRQAARQRAVASFSEARQIERWVELYRSLAP
ncbi:MAG: glycosyltransferase family 4 protein, partial [Thiobacillus sp.]